MGLGFFKTNRLFVFSARGGNITEPFLDLDNVLVHSLRSVGENMTFVADLFRLYCNALTGDQCPAGNRKHQYQRYQE